MHAAISDYYERSDDRKHQRAKGERTKRLTAPG
jgi:hypothetical protein